MPDTPTILIFVRCYLPGHKSGGPVRSVSNLVERLGDEFHFRIVTSDRDSGDTEPYPSVTPGQWQPVGKAEVLYLAPGERTWSRAKHILRDTDYDAVYFNSLFDSFFALRPLASRRFGSVPSKPAILAPRGELSPGALALKSTKKRFFLAFARMLGLYRNLQWHASAEEEAEHIRDHFGRDAQVHIAPNVPGRPPDPDSLPRQPKQQDKLRVVFLSRIVPKKNLDGALRILQRVSGGEVRFTVYGTLEDQTYWQSCEELASRLPSNVHFEYGGALDRENVLSTLSRDDLFFFPTHGENFGHVIVEAFQAGLPVLVSDQTPWRGLEEKRVGWDLPLDHPERFREVIEMCAGMEAEEFGQLSQNAFAYGREIAESDEPVEQHRELFQRALVRWWAEATMDHSRIK